ncbi:MAG: diacylglycerol/lipid kinase family protein [Candidatus Binatia bacterium]
MAQSSIARLLVNPVSGKGRGSAVAEQARRELRHHGFSPEMLYSRSAADLGELARQAVRDRCPLVIGVGGDGLVSQVGNALIGSDTVLGIIPAGVGNDFARGLGIPLNVSQACAVLAQQHARRIDVGQANDRYFFSVAVMGFAAEVNRRANQFGRLRVNALYTALTVATALTDNPLPFTVTYDGHQRRCYSWLIAVGNTWSCARGMALVPGAQPDDGLLDACVVNGMGRFELLYVFPRVFRGTHVYHTGIETLRGREISIRADGPCEIYADGERIGPLPAVLRAVPQALSVIVPNAVVL